MAQNHQNHVGSRGSTQHLNPHIFTLTVPPEKALAIRSILEKLQDDFDLGDSGLTWKYNKQQWESRQPEPQTHFTPDTKTSTSTLEQEPLKSLPHTLPSSTKKWSSRLSKLQPLSLSYANVRIDEIIDHAVRTWWRGLANNLYHLPPGFYFLVFMGLSAWAFGSLVCGYFEALASLQANDESAAWPAFWRGALGAIPALTGIITFLFPPTFCVRYR